MLLMDAENDNKNSSTEEGEIDDENELIDDIGNDDNDPEVIQYKQAIRQLSPSLRCTCCGDVYSDPVRLPSCSHVMNRDCVCIKRQHGKLVICPMCTRRNYIENPDELDTDYDVAFRIPPKPSVWIARINRQAEQSNLQANNVEKSNGVGRNLNSDQNDSDDSETVRQNKKRKRSRKSKKRHRGHSSRHHRSHSHGGHSSKTYSSNSCTDDNDDGDEENSFHSSASDGFSDADHDHSGFFKSNIPPPTVPLFGGTPSFLTRPPPPLLPSSFAPYGSTPFPYYNRPPPTATSQNLLIASHKNLTPLEQEQLQRQLNQSGLISSPVMAPSPSQPVVTRTTLLPLPLPSMSPVMSTSKISLQGGFSVQWSPGATPVMPTVNGEDSSERSSLGGFAMPSSFSTAPPVALSPVTVASHLDSICGGFQQVQETSNHSYATSDNFTASPFPEAMKTPMLITVPPAQESFPGGLPPNSAVGSVKIDNSAWTPIMETPRSTPFEPTTTPQMKESPHYAAAATPTVVYNSTFETEAAFQIWYDSLTPEHVGAFSKQELHDIFFDFYQHQHEAKNNESTSNAESWKEFFLKRFRQRVTSALPKQRPLAVKTSPRVMEDKHNGRGEAPAHHFCVANLPPGTKAQQIQDILRKCGRVLCIRVVCVVENGAPQYFASVSMDSDKSIEKSISLLHGSTCFDVNYPLIARKAVANLFVE